MFGCDELANARIRPFWTSSEDVRATWLSAGRAMADFPEKLTVINLGTLVKLAMTPSNLDGNTLMLIANGKATGKAQELQERDEACEGELREAGLGEEPPPLEGEGASEALCQRGWNSSTRCPPP